MGTGMGKRRGKMGGKEVECRERRKEQRDGGREGRGTDVSATFAGRVSNVSGRVCKVSAMCLQRVSDVSAMCPRSD